MSRSPLDPEGRGADELDLRPVIEPDLLDLRVSLSSLVHWADSQEVRRRVMRAIEFPVDDVAMFLVVNRLSYRGALRPSELASELGTGRANITKIVHRLADLGLVFRVRAPDDDRSVLIVLTPEGREFGVRIMENSRRTLESTLDGWTADELTALRTALARLAGSTLGDDRDER